MKRLTSILCALMVFMSANAAPQLNTKRLAVEKQKFEQKALPFAKDARATKPVLRAPQAKQAVTNVTATVFQSNYSAGNGFVMNSLIDGVNLVEYDFAIIPAQGETTIQSGKTYTIADMDSYYCYWFDNDWNGADFYAVSFTWTKAADGAESVVVDATDANGDAFHITYEKAAPEPVEEVIDIEFAKSCTMTYYTSSKDWYLVAQNADYAVVLDILSDSTKALPAGSYEAADFDLEYTGVYDFEVGYNIIKATSAAAEVSKDGDRTDIIAVLKCTDGKTYRVKMFNEPVVLKDPVEVTIPTVGGTDYGTDMYYVLKNEAADSIFYFDIIKEESAADVTLGKTYTKDDMDASYSFMKLNNTNISYNTAEFVKTKTDGLVRIEATVSDKDGNVYHLVYQEKGVEPTGEEVTLAFDSAMAVPQYYTDGAWELYTEQGDTAAYFVFVNHNPASPAGTYTVDDLQASYSGIVFGDTYISFFSGEFTVTDTNERIDLTADMLGKNGVLYHISMFFLKPQAAGQETITATNLEINTAYYSYYGVGIFTASDENNAVELTININGLGAEMAGTYYVGSDFNGEITPAEGEATELYSGNVTITVDAETGNISLSGTVLAVNLTEYTLDLTYIKPEPQTYNITVASAVGNYQESSGRIQYTLNSEDGNYRFFFVIYLEEGQEDVETGKIYDFTNDMHGNTNTSYGINYVKYDYIDYAEASFVKTIVDKKEHIEATVLDVNGDTWKLSYTGTEEIETAIDNTNAAVKAVKTIENGHVVIIKNGVRFNAQGAVVK